MHVPEQFIHTQLDTRPLLRDEWMFERLRHYPDLEVMPVGRIGLLIVSREYETVNANAQATVALDVDDQAYESTDAERKARRLLFPQDHTNVGTRVFDAMRPGLDPGDPLSLKDGSAYPGVYDPLTALLLLRQTDPRDPFNVRTEQAASLLRVAKQEGIYTLPNPVTVGAGDWIPEIFPHMPQLIGSIESSLSCRPMMLTYGDLTAQIEKWLPFYLMEMSSALFVMTVRKRIGLEYLMKNPDADPGVTAVRERLLGWIAASGGKFVYGSEDTHDVERVLQHIAPVASKKYGIVVTAKGTWAAEQYKLGTVYPDGIRELSFMHRKVRKPAGVNRFLRSLLSGSSYVGSSLSQ